MLSFDTVHAITGSLITIGLRADLRHPGGPPALLVLRDQRGHTNEHSTPRLVHADVFPLAPPLSRPDPAGLDTILQRLAEHLTLLRPAGILRTDRAAHRLLAWALLYDDNPTDPGSRPHVRRTDALDVDGRLYRISRLETEGQPVVTVDDQPDPASAPPTAHGLARLLHATTPTPR